jgi:ADP-ribosylglycohydrolase
MRTAESNRKRKYTGCLIGAAVGDALGMQTEGRSRKELAQQRVKDYARAPQGHPNHKLQPGQYTDDTEQTLILAESIIEAGGFDIEVFSKKLQKWGERLMENPELNRLVGPTSMQAIENMISGKNWHESGVPSDSCGSAMRAAPIGLLSADVDEVVEFAVLSSLPTHTGSGAIAGSVAVAISVSMNVNSTPPEKILSEVVSRIEHIDEVMAGRIACLRHIDTSPSSADDFFGEQGVSNSVYEVVPAAFFVFLQHTNCFEDAIIAAVNCGGDTDSVACVAGSMLGARLGIDAIPKRWVMRLENREYIEELALQLFSISHRE